MHKRENLKYVFLKDLLVFAYRTFLALSSAYTVYIFLQPPHNWKDFILSSLKEFVGKNRPTGRYKIKLQAPLLLPRWKNNCQFIISIKLPEHNSSQQHENSVVDFFIVFIKTIFFPEQNIN